MMLTRLLAALAAAPLFTVAAAMPARAPSSTPASPSIAIVNVAVIPMDRERVLHGQTVLVREDRIVALGPVAKIRVPAGAIRIDGRGKFLMPGLADMHVHLGNHLLPGTLGTSEMPGSVTVGADADSLVAEIERTLLAFLASGVTTVRNMDAGPWHLTLRRRVAAGELPSPRIYTSGPTLLSVPMPDVAARIVSEQQAAGYDFLKLHVDGGLEIDPEVFDTFVAAARRARMPIAGHTPLGKIGLERMLQARPASIEHLTGYLQALIPGDSIRGRTISEHELERWPLDESRIPALAAATARAGVWNCPTQVIYDRLFRAYYPDTAVRQRYLALRGKVIRALHDAGAGLLLGTDVTSYGAYGLVPGVSLHQELERLVAAGLTPYEALETGTRNVAAFLGTLDSTGTIGIGKRADLVLLEASPLVDIRNTTKIWGVMANGHYLDRAALDAMVPAGAGWGGRDRAG